MYAVELQLNWSELYTAANRLFVCELTCGLVAASGQFCALVVSLCPSLYLFEGRGPRATMQYWRGDLSQPIRRRLEVFARKLYREAVFFAQIIRVCLDSVGSTARELSRIRLRFWVLVLVCIFL